MLFFFLAIDSKDWRTGIHNTTILKTPARFCDNKEVKTFKNVQLLLNMFTAVRSIVTILSEHLPLLIIKDIFLPIVTIYNVF